jgi:hypothetical protein
MKAKVYNDYVRINAPCGHHHYIRIKEALPDYPEACVWGFNNDFENPTFSPSINETTGDLIPNFNEGVYQGTPENFAEWREHMRKSAYRCHFIVTGGRIHYCGDCTHNLAGQTLDLLEIE